MTDPRTRTLGWLLAGAFLLGLLVTALHPAYRGALRAIWSGAPETSPIWRSNERYYPRIGPRGEEVRPDAR